MSNYIRAMEEDFGKNTEVKSSEIDLSLNRSLDELLSSYWEFRDSDEVKTVEEESEFGALEDYLDGSFGFVSHLI